MGLKYHLKRQLLVLRRLWSKRRNRSYSEILILFLNLGFSQLAEPLSRAGSDRGEANQDLGEKSKVERCVLRLPGCSVKPGPRENFALCSFKVRSVKRSKGNNHFI